MPKPIFIHESITSCRRLSSPASALKNLSFLCEDGKALQRSLGGTRGVVATCKMSIFLVLRTDMHRLCKRFRKSLLGTKIKSLPSVLILPCFFMFFKQYWWLLLKDSNLSLILFGVLDTSVFRVQMWRSGTTYFFGEWKSYRMPYWNCVSPRASAWREDFCLGFCPPFILSGLTVTAPWDGL